MKNRKRPADPLWDSKDDSKRRNWKDQEVMAMLNLMKKHNLLEHVPTDAQLGETLLKPMKNLGYNRTSHQIKLKIKSLRKNYVQSRKGNLESLKSCIFYELLDSLYRHTEAKDSESEEGFCEIEDDSMMWLESDVNRLLLIVKQLELGHEISLGNIPLKCLRQIHKSLQNFNINKSVDKIKALLISLRNTYIKYKKELANGCSVEHHPYLDQLDVLWKREYANGNFYFADGYDEFWSEEETILLLEAVKEIGVKDITTNSDFAAGKIEEFLSDSGYKRTKFQILKRIENLKQNYSMAKQCENLDEAIAKFPFYHRFEDVFKVSHEMRNKQPVSKLEPDTREKFEFEDLIVLEKKKHYRGYVWTEEEICTLLNLVKEMNMISIFRGRMTLEFVSQLVTPLKTKGFERTAEQIKIKLKCLRNTYYRCIHSNFSEKSLIDCPYFERIHEMVQILDQSSHNIPYKWKLTMNRSNKIKKKDSILKDIEVDEHDQNFVNVLDTGIINNDNTLKSKNQSDLVLWEPLETIPDEEDYESNYHEIIVNEEEDKMSDMFEEVSDEEVNKNELQVVDEDHIIEINDGEEEQEKSQEEYVKYSDVKFSEVGTSTINVSTNGSGSIQILAARSVDCQRSDDMPIDVNVIGNLFDNEEIKEDEECVEFKNDLIKSKSMKDVLSEVMKHEELLQKQHQLWLERQFEIQRKHDKEQRDEILNELRQLRCLIASSNIKQDV